MDPISLTGGTEARSASDALANNPRAAANATAARPDARGGGHGADDAAPTVPLVGTGESTGSDAGAATGATLTTPTESPASSAGVVPAAGLAAGRDAEATNRAASTDSAAAAVRELVREQLAELTREARLPTNAELSFHVDPQTRTPHVQVVHRETGDVIRDIELTALAGRFATTGDATAQAAVELAGLLVDEEA